MIARAGNLEVGHLDKQSPIPVLEGHKQIYLCSNKPITNIQKFVCACELIQLPQHHVVQNEV